MERIGIFGKLDLSSTEHPMYSYSYDVKDE